jgi:hypothetical protein
MADLWRAHPWLKRNVGTLTARHAQAMEFQTLGRVMVDPARLTTAVVEPTKPMSAAVNDITIANHIKVRGLDPDWARAIARGRRPPVQIDALADIADPI